MVPCDGAGLNTEMSDDDRRGLEDIFCGDREILGSDGSDSDERVSDNVLDSRVFFRGASLF